MPVSIEDRSHALQSLLQRLRQVLAKSERSLQRANEFGRLAAERASVHQANAADAKKRASGLSRHRAG